MVQSRTKYTHSHWFSIKDLYPNDIYCLLLFLLLLFFISSNKMVYFSIFFLNCTAIVFFLLFLLHREQLYFIAMDLCIFATQYTYIVVVSSVNFYWRNMCSVWKWENETVATELPWCVLKITCSELTNGLFFH